MVPLQGGAHPRRNVSLPSGLRKLPCGIAHGAEEEEIFVEKRGVGASLLRFVGDRGDHQFLHVRSSGGAVLGVAGQRVELRISFRSASWHYGDGTSETTTSPGKPYDEAHDPCSTAQCAHYSGHTYTRTGRATVSLTITWHAEYRVGAQWFDIDGDITGPSSRHDLTVMQSRDVLVPNPGG